MDYGKESGVKAMKNVALARGKCAVAPTGDGTFWLLHRDGVRVRDLIWAFVWHGIDKKWP